MTVYLLSYYITAGILIPILSWVLYKVYKGRNFKFVKRTIWLLIICNIGNIAFAFSNRDFTVSMERNLGYSLLNSGSKFVQTSSFNEANWVFAYRYFTISQGMPYALNGQVVPAEIIRRNQMLGFVLLVLNFVFPLMQGVAYYNANMKLPDDPNYKGALLFVVAANLLVVILQIISAVFFGYSLLKIRQSLK